MKHKHINCYVKVMKEIDIAPEAKQRIARNCARYSTLYKIKSGNFVITANRKEKTTDG